MRRFQKQTIETGAAWSDKVVLALDDATRGLKARHRRQAESDWGHYRRAGATS